MDIVQLCLLRLKENYRQCINEVNIPLKSAEVFEKNDTLSASITIRCMLIKLIL